jgi:hypothetical protein
MNSQTLEQLQATFKQQSAQLENVKEALSLLSADQILALPPAWLEQLDAAADTVRSLPSGAAYAASSVPLQFTALRA